MSITHVHPNRGRPVTVFMWRDVYEDGKRKLATDGEPIQEMVEEFNGRLLEFLTNDSGEPVALIETEKGFIRARHICRVRFLDSEESERKLNSAIDSLQTSSGS